jgi:hypothetical protein
LVTNGLLNAGLQQGEEGGAFCEPAKRKKADCDAVMLDEESGVVFLQMRIGSRFRRRMKDEILQEADAGARSG